jgi:hypothetical protein
LPWLGSVEQDSHAPRAQESLLHPRQGRIASQDLVGSKRGLRRGSVTEQQVMQHTRRMTEDGCELLAPVASPCESCRGQPLLEFKSGVCCKAKAPARHLPHSSSTGLLLLHLHGSVASPSIDSCRGSLSRDKIDLVLWLVFLQNVGASRESWIWLSHSKHVDESSELHP